jgi:hypothetical protein
MSLVLPSDVTYISASGVFLTEQASTPEPSSVMLLGVGIVCLFRLRRWPARQRIGA